MTKYPLTITEIPHLGKPRTWTLESEEHLAGLIEDAERRGYTDWQIAQGNLVYAEGPDGELIETHNVAFTVEAYLDWLRDDLSQLIVGD